MSSHQGDYRADVLVKYILFDKSLFWPVFAGLIVSGQFIFFKEIFLFLLAKISINVFRKNRTFQQKFDCSLELNDTKSIF